MTLALESFLQTWHDKVLPALATKTVLLASGVIGGTNFVLADALTDNKGFAIALAVLSTIATTMGTAYFNNRPKVIAAQAAREASRHAIAEASSTAIYERMSNLHRDETKLKERENERLQFEIKMITLAKHSAIGALDNAQWHIWLQQQECLKHGHESLPYARVAIDNIFNEQDDELKKLVREYLGKRKESTQP